MANQRHVDILLRDGVARWNLWRRQEPEIKPHLREAVCVRTNFSGATLAGCTVYGISAWDMNLDDDSKADIPLSKQSERALHDLLGY
jgi:hypothetical protein